MMNKYHSIFIIFSILIAQEHAGYAGSSYENGTDARSIAMGNAMTAGTESHFAAYYNPAGITSNTKRTALFSHQFLTIDRNLSTVSIKLPLPPVAGISISWIGAGVNEIQGRDLSGNKTKVLTASEDMIMLSFGVKPANDFQLGGSVKILQNRLPNLYGNISGTGVGFDFGTIYSINSNLNIALVLKNINSSYQWSNKIEDDLSRTYEDKFPIQLRSGIEYKYSNILLSGDIGGYFINKKYLDYNVRLGVEYIIEENYFIRGGYRNNTISLGIGLKLKQFDKINSFFDYALVIENVSGLSHIISYAVTL